MLRSIALLLIHLMAFNLSVVLCCSVGEYLYSYSNDPIDEYCGHCPAGHYCPGNDHYYKCPPGTIASKVGTISCTPCKNRTNSQATFCLLDDTPIDAKEIALMKDGNLYKYYTLDDGHVFLFDIVKANDFLSYESCDSIRYSFSPMGSTFEFPLVIFASSLTGQPSESNHQWRAKGVYSDLIIPLDTIDNKTFVQISFKVITEMKNPYVGRVRMAFNKKPVKIINITLKNSTLEENITKPHRVFVKVIGVIVMSLMVVVCVYIWKKMRIAL